MVDTRWHLSPHAERRMEEMGVDHAEVRQVLGDYETEYPGSKRYPAGRMVRTGGRLAIVYVVATKEIITVLWHRQDSRQNGPTHRKRP